MTKPSSKDRVQVYPDPEGEPGAHRFRRVSSRGGVVATSKESYISEYQASLAARREHADLSADDRETDLDSSFIEVVEK